MVGRNNPIFKRSSTGMHYSKGGIREDLGIYVRSRWEANYCRYLNFLQQQQAILTWEYEPKTFHFSGVKRNPISYTPDFKVTYPNGRVEWHEVKGYMDSVSRGKLKRMAKFYPAEKVIIIGQAEYRAIAKWATMIPGWEIGKEGE